MSVGALKGTVPGSGFRINQTFLVLTTVYVMVPSLMVVGSRVTPARMNRTANVVVSLIYVVSVIGSAVGESWTYYLVGSAIEVILLLAIARVAWTWPRQ